MTAHPGEGFAGAFNLLRCGRCNKVHRPAANFCPRCGLRTAKLSDDQFAALAAAFAERPWPAEHGGPGVARPVAGARRPLYRESSRSGPGLAGFGSRTATGRPAAAAAAGRSDGGRQGKAPLVLAIVGFGGAFVMLAISGFPARLDNDRPQVWSPAVSPPARFAPSAPPDPWSGQAWPVPTPGRVVPPGTPWRVEPPAAWPRDLPTPPAGWPPVPPLPPAPAAPVGSETWSAVPGYRGPSSWGAGGMTPGGIQHDPNARSGNGPSIQHD